MQSNATALTKLNVNTNFLLFCASKKNVYVVGAILVFFIDFLTTATNHAIEFLASVQALNLDLFGLLQLHCGSFQSGKRTTRLTQLEKHQILEKVLSLRLVTLFFYCFFLLLLLVIISFIRISIKVQKHCGFCRQTLYHRVDLNKILYILFIASCLIKLFLSFELVKNNRTIFKVFHSIKYKILINTYAAQDFAFPCHRFSKQKHFHIKLKL